MYLLLLLGIHSTRASGHIEIPRCVRLAPSASALLAQDKTRHRRLTVKVPENPRRICDPTLQRLSCISDLPFPVIMLHGVFTRLQVSSAPRSKWVIDKVSYFARRSNDRSSKRQSSTSYVDGCVTICIPGILHAKMIRCT